jgi:hypothetical protein
MIARRKSCSIAEALNMIERAVPFRHCQLRSPPANSRSSRLFARVALRSGAGTAVIWDVHSTSLIARSIRSSCG